MLQHVRRIGSAMKIALICFVISFALFVGISTPTPQKQSFDLKSATLISIGFGASFGLVHNGKKII